MSRYGTENSWLESVCAREEVLRAGRAAEPMQRRARRPVGGHACVALEARDEHRAVDGVEARILAGGFVASSPSWIPEDVHIRRPDQG